VECLGNSRNNIENKDQPQRAWDEEVASTVPSLTQSKADEVNLVPM
jgi:hypothetical protein